jgi:thymine-DNA glycosylase
MWVMPSSSARCAQLPRAADKVPFYASLKKFRDYLNGHIKDLDESEFVFNDPKLKAICDVSLDQLKIDNTGSVMFGNEINDSAQMDPRSEGMQDDPLNYQNNKTVDGNIVLSNKKKRGRPKKVKGDGDETLPKIPRRTALQNYENEFNDDGTQRKKRGRPKKSKQQQSNNLAKNPESQFDNKEGILALPPIDNINNRTGISENNDGQMNNMSMNHNSSLINHHEQNNFLTHHPQHMQRIMHHDQSENGFMHNQMISHSQQQQHLPIHMPQHLQHNHMQQHQHQHQQQHQQQHPQMLPHIHQQPMHSLTPPMNIRYNTSRSTPNSNSNASVGQNFQNSPQHQTTPTFSDLSSEISAAISSDHMGDSPTPALPSLGQTDFETPVSLNSDNTSNVCQEIVGVRTLSRENKHQNQHTPSTNFHSTHLQSHSIDNAMDTNRSYSPYQTPNYTPDNDHQSHQIQQQRSVSNNFILNRNLVSSPLPPHQRPSEQIQQQKPQLQQQQQTQQQLPHHQQQSLGNTTDVASKSLSGLESLVDQIPSIGDHNVSGGGTISPVSLNNAGGTTPNSSSNVDTEKVATPTTSLPLENSQFGSNSCLYSSGYTNSPTVPPHTSSSLLPSNAYPVSSSSSNFTSTPPGLLSNTYGSSVPATIPSHFSVSSLTTPNYHPSTTAAAYHSNLMNPLVHHHGPTLFSVPVSPLYHPHAYQHSGYPTAYQPPTLHMPSPNYPYGYPPTNTYTSAPGTPSYHPMFDRHLKPDLGYGGF